MMKAVVFDMDGVLFDTEYLISLAWQEIADKDGMENIDVVLKDCIGRSYEDTRIVFRDAYGEDFGFDDFREKTRVIFFDHIEKNGLPIKLGAQELLEYLKEEGFRIGLASSSKKESIHEHLKTSGFEKYFEFIIGGDMVKESKPHPEIYELACKGLGVEPGEAYCIEDSFNGVRSASLAGLKVIMVPDLLEPTSEIRTLLYRECKSLVEVKEHLEEIKKHNKYFDK